VYPLNPIFHLHIRFSPKRSTLVLGGSVSTESSFSSPAPSNMRIIFVFPIMSPLKFCGNFQLGVDVLLMPNYITVIVELGP
jgi:hypothetical protein